MLGKFVCIYSLCILMIYHMKRPCISYSCNIVRECWLIIRTHARMHACTHTRTHTHMCMHVHMHQCTHACTTHTYMNTNTHTHTYPSHVLHVPDEGQFKISYISFVILKSDRISYLISTSHTVSVDFHAILDESEHMLVRMCRCTHT